MRRLPAAAAGRVGGVEAVADDANGAAGEPEGLLREPPHGPGDGHHPVGGVGGTAAEPLPGGAEEGLVLVVLGRDEVVRPAPSCEGRAEEVGLEEVGVDDVGPHLPQEARGAENAHGGPRARGAEPGHGHARGQELRGELPPALEVGDGGLHRAPLRQAPAEDEDLLLRPAAVEGRHEMEDAHRGSVGRGRRGRS